MRPQAAPPSRKRSGRGNNGPGRDRTCDLGIKRRTLESRPSSVELETCGFRLIGGRSISGAFGGAGCPKVAPGRRLSRPPRLPRNWRALPPDTLTVRLSRIHTASALTHTRLADPHPTSPSGTTGPSFEGRSRADARCSRSHARARVEGQASHPRRETGLLAGPPAATAVLHVAHPIPRPRVRNSQRPPPRRRLARGPPTSVGDRPWIPGRERAPRRLSQEPVRR